MAALDELKQEVQKKFSEVRGALHMREKLLLRQIEVIAHQKQGCAPSEGQVNFLVEEEEQLLAAIRSFGRFQLDNMQLALQDIYLKQEDYIAPMNDHETMYKCLQQSTGGNGVRLGMPDEEEENSEAIVVDFSKNKSLLEHNRQHMNESIINITLQEAKELIRKAKAKRETPIPPLNLEELDDELESSIAEAVSSLGRCREGRDSPVNTKFSQTFLEAVCKKAKKNRFKPKITINNCNGTINLRNISSLTINCATEDAVTAEVPLQATNLHTAEDEVNSEGLTHSRSSKSSQKSSRKLTPPPTLQTPTAQQPATVTVETSSTGTSTPTTTATSSSNYSSNCSSRSQSKKQKNSKKSQQTKSQTLSSTNAQTSTGTTAYPYQFVDDNDEDDGVNNAATCDFYNRLLNEIKNSLKETKSKRNNETIWITSDREAQTPATQPYADVKCVDGSTTNNNTTTSDHTSSHCTTTQTTGKRLILKNFENLKIILEANSGDEESFHPVQIEQWLAEIISETDLEPMQNTDILEHSKIHNNST